MKGKDCRNNGNEEGTDRRSGLYGKVHVYTVAGADSVVGQRRKEAIQDFYIRIEQSLTFLQGHDETGTDKHLLSMTWNTCASYRVSYTASIIMAFYRYR